MASSSAVLLDLFGVAESKTEKFSYQRSDGSPGFKETECKLEFKTSERIPVDNGRILAICDDNIVRLFEPKTGKVVNEWKKLPDLSGAKLAYVADRKEAIVYGRDIQKPFILKINDPKDVQTIKIYDSQLRTDVAQVGVMSAGFLLVQLANDKDRDKQLRVFFHDIKDKQLKPLKVNFKIKSKRQWIVVGNLLFTLSLDTKKKKDKTNPLDIKIKIFSFETVGKDKGKFTEVYSCVLNVNPKASDRQLYRIETLPDLGLLLFTVKEYLEKPGSVMPVEFTKTCVIDIRKHFDLKEWKGFERLIKLPYADDFLMIPSSDSSDAVPQLLDRRANMTTKLKPHQIIQCNHPMRTDLGDLVYIENGVIHTLEHPGPLNKVQVQQVERDAEVVTASTVVRRKSFDLFSQPPAVVDPDYREVVDPGYSSTTKIMWKGA